jgi:predicted MFS family arabinose efflux permease
MMMAAILLTALAMAVLPFAGSVSVVAIAIVVLGLATGPLDIALFTVRQRRTDPAWFGRAFAVSMSVNAAGVPIGSGLAGPLVVWSLDGALWAAVMVTLVSAVLLWMLVPARDDGAAVAAVS